MWLYKYNGGGSFMAGKCGCGCEDKKTAKKPVKKTGTGKK